MILNIIFGFIVPWFFGVILYFKDKKLLLVIAPFMSVWAYALNEIIFYFNFNRFIPLSINEDITTMSVNLGLFPILGSYFIYFVKLKRFSPYTLVVFFVLMTTLAEYLALMFGLLTYDNGWNIGWSLLS